MENSIWTVKPNQQVITNENDVDIKWSVCAKFWNVHHDWNFHTLERDFLESKRLQSSYLKLKKIFNAKLHRLFASYQVKTWATSQKTLTPKGTDTSKINQSRTQRPYFEVMCDTSTIVDKKRSEKPVGNWNQRYKHTSWWRIPILRSRVMRMELLSLGICLLTVVKKIKWRRKGFV